MQKCLFVLAIGFTILVCSCAPKSSLSNLDADALRTYQEAKLDYFNGALEKAEKGFREMCRAHGDFHQAHFMLGKTVFALGRMDEAEKVFHDLVRTYPGYHEAAIWLVRAELANKKIDEAEKRLEDLLGFDSGDSRILALYARLSQLKNDTQNALRYYQLSVQHEEEMAFSHFEMARYYFQFGMQSKALTEIDKCLLLLPFENSMRRAVEELKKNILSEKETKNAQE